MEKLKTTARAVVRRINSALNAVEIGVWVVILVAGIIGFAISLGLAAFREVLEFL